MGKKWYQYSDKSRKIINGSLLSPPEPHDPELYEELEENDPRVQEWHGPIFCRKKYQKYKLKNINDLLTIMKWTEHGPFTFRGQSNYEWGLESNIERGQSENSRKFVGLERYEHRVLIEALRKYHNYLSEKPKDDDIIGWLALLQHNGAPTRLLDSTHSIFIAAYFASIDTSMTIPGAIWIFNTNNINIAVSHQASLARHANELLKPPESRFVAVADGYKQPMIEQFFNLSNIDLSLFLKSLELDYPTLIKLGLLGKLSFKGVLSFEPQWLSKRLNYQQGLFLCPLNLKYNFSENLNHIMCENNIFSDKEKKEFQKISFNSTTFQKGLKNAFVIKLLVSPSLKSELKRYLPHLNIRSDVLFPDIDGVSKFLREILPNK